MVTAVDFDATTEELRATVVDSAVTMEEELTVTAVDLEVTTKEELMVTS